MNDWNLVGHDWAVRRLTSAIAAGHLAQSHVFIGPPSIGKAALARAATLAILSAGAVDPARARRLADADRHPDLNWIEPQDGSIKVEVVRDLLHTLTLAPLEGRYRVAVIDQAQRVTESGQNAILKTLEEPNPSAVIMLLAPGVDSLLPTIVSRCQVLNLRPVAENAICQALVERGVDEDRARLVARLSRGRVGWALQAVADETLLADRKQRLDDLNSLLASNRTRRLVYSEALAKESPETVVTVLELWSLFWRDVARLAGGGGRAPIERVLNVDYAEAMASIAGHVPLNAAANMLRHTRAAIKAMQQNANPRLALDALLLRYPALQPVNP